MLWDTLLTPLRSFGELAESLHAWSLCEHPPAQSQQLARIGFMPSRCASMPKCKHTDRGKEAVRDSFTAHDRYVPRGHCERSEAIPLGIAFEGDCFVARYTSCGLLAMTFMRDVI